MSELGRGVPTRFSRISSVRRRGGLGTEKIVITLLPRDNDESRDGDFTLDGIWRKEFSSIHQFSRHKSDLWMVKSQREEFQCPIQNA